MPNVKSLKLQQVGPNYKWVALSNTTLGSLMSAIDGSILMIALPSIFRGINLNPLAPDNSSLLLWLLMGYPLVQAVLVVTLGRIGDMFGRVRMYNLGFVIFSAGSILLSFTWSTGTTGALELIIFRLVQALGGAMLMANSAAIITDAFPMGQRGLALGINQMAMIAGMLIGTFAGGLLVQVGWRWVFRVSVPVGVIGTIWAYLALRETGIHRVARIDWLGNLTLAIGVTLILFGITSGINPTPTSVMSWETPHVLGMLIGGVILLMAFAFVEQRAKEPLFRLDLFKIRQYAAGNIASLCSSIARMGLGLMMVIWLQGIWLPLHGYDFEVTPLWAGIYMLPQTTGFLLAGPISGRLSDRYGPRIFTVAGMILSALALFCLRIIPVNFAYPVFALIIFINGASNGLFASPNGAAIMNSVPPESRGAANGMRVAFLNFGSPLSNAMIFSLMIVGLNATAGPALYSGLVNSGISSSVAQGIANQPPMGYLFATFLGYNPLRTLLGPANISQLPASTVQTVTSREFFPQLISGPFQNALSFALIFSVALCLIAAVTSLFRGQTSGEKEPVKTSEVGKIKAVSSHHTA